MASRASVKPMRANGKVTAKSVSEWDFTIRTEEMPFCCGVHVFGVALCYKNGVTDDLDESGTAAFAGAILTQEHGPCGLCLYTTNEEQVQEKRALAKAGYRVVATFQSPGTKRWCQLHAKLVNQPRTAAPRRQRGVRRTTRR